MNLPFSTTSFVGREAELRELDTAVKSSRLVTLVGVGGTGKTRLALEYARSGTWPHGAWFVELASITSQNLIQNAAATAFNLKDQTNDALITFLSDKSLLLIVDNCEHLLAPTARFIEHVIDQCPGIHILATSREQLRARNETTLSVPPLKVATQLFIERATDVDPIANEEAIKAICDRLDGIPLAIELAAAQTKTKSTQEILLWLSARFKLLTGGTDTPVKRHQTLRSLIDWSFELLDDDEKTVMLSASVFRGGWRLEQAESACQIGGIDQSDVLDLLTSLVERSLIEQSNDRYRMLETIREYASDRLLESGDAAAVRDLHATAYITLAERLKNEPSTIRLLDADHDNLRAALTWLLADEENSEGAYELCASAWRYWSQRGFLVEGADWIAQTLHRSQAGVPLRFIGEVHCGAGTLASLQGDFEKAEYHFEKSIEVLRKTPDRRALAQSINTLGSVFALRGEGDRAKPLYEQALEMRREVNDERGIAGSLNNLAIYAIENCDTEQAQRLLMECLAIYERLGDSNYAALAFKNLGTVAEHQGRLNQAKEHYSNALAIHREQGDHQRTAAACGHLGLLSLKMGEIDQGEAFFDECRSIREEIGDQRGLLDSLGDQAAVDLWKENYDAAREAFNHSIRERTKIGDKRGVANDSFYLGIIELQCGNSDEAVELFRTILTARESLKDARGIAYANLWLAKATQDCDALKEAINGFTKVRDQLGSAQCVEAVDPHSESAKRFRSKVGSARPRFEETPPICAEGIDTSGLELA